MNLKSMLISLAPWLVFTVGVRALGTPWVGAVAVAALLLVIASVITRRHRGATVIDVTGVITFGVLTAVALAGGATAQEFVVDYGRGGCAAVLGLVMAISAVTVPFTEQYARDVVPSQYWRTPRFRSVNRKISALWAGIVLIHSACHLLAGHLAAINPTHVEPRPLGGVLNWIIPIGLTLAGVRLTRDLASTQYVRNPATVS